MTEFELSPKLLRCGDSRLPGRLTIPMVKPIAFLFVWIPLLISGCGRLGPPLPPEAFAPAPVQELTIAVDTNGVGFQWEPPSDDRRGDPLEELSGFAILRAEPEDMALFLSDPTGVSETIGGLFDQQVNLLYYKQQKALDEGRPMRREEVPEEFRFFSFFDETPKPETRYLYMVVGVNQGGVLGSVEKYVRVDFRGENSDFEIFSPEELIDLE